MLAVRTVLSALSLTSRAPHVQLQASTTSTCESLLRGLFDGAVDADAVAAACSADVEWDDMGAASAVTGQPAVRELISAKFPPGSKLVLDRVSDGVSSGGFVWHRYLYAGHRTIALLLRYPRATLPLCAGLT